MTLVRRFVVTLLMLPGALALYGVSILAAAQEVSDRCVGGNSR